MEEKVIELRIHIPKIHLSPKFWKWGLAGLLVLALAENPATESVTLTTYYPAPAGAYNNMVTIGNTWLARDMQSSGAQSFVEIGNNTFQNPLSGPQYKLDVENGAIRLTNSGGGSSADDWIGTGGAFGGDDLALNGKSGTGVELDSNNQSVALFGVGNWGSPSGTADAYMPGNLQVGGGGWGSGPGQLVVGPGIGFSGTNQSYIHINANNACMSMGPGQDNASCPGGYYATWTPGIYVETPGGYSGPGWDHAKYQLDFYNFVTGQWVDARQDCATAWNSVQLKAEFPDNNGGVSGGYTNVCVAGEGLYGSNGANRWWCCPK
jgi:hypothetical protein